MAGNLVKTSIPHGNFDDHSCGGYLIGVITGSSAIVLCNKCMALMRRVPRKEGLFQALHELELELALAVLICGHCGWVNLVPGLKEYDPFICRRCWMSTLWSEFTQELYFFIGCQSV
jgi:hypothetical protein